MEDRSHALIAIAFLVVFGIGAALITFWMMGPSKTLVPYLLQSKQGVSRLGTGSGVSYKGIHVGTVRSIHLDKKDRTYVNVLIAVDKSFPLPRGSYAEIASSGVFGSKYVDLHLGDSQTMIQTSAQHPARLHLKTGRLGSLMEQAQGIVGKVNSTLKSVQSLVSKQNRARIDSTLKNIQQASARLATLEQAAQPSLKAMPHLIRNAQTTLTAAHRVLAQADKLVASARQPVRRIGSAASAATGLVMQLNQTTVTQLDALMRRLGTLSGRLQSLVDMLQRTPQSLIKGPARKLAGPGETRGTPQRSYGGG